MTKRSSRRNKRFPRLDLDSKVFSIERILRLTYNKMRKSRGSLKFHNFHYDVYATKRGWKAKLSFLFLGEKLIQKNIDPSLYIKVMCRYGKFKEASFLPSPVWLMKDSTIEKFMWVYRRERRSYVLRTDWKKELDGWSDLDIYSSIRASTGMVEQAMNGQGWKAEETIRMLWEELSPWFIAVHALKNPKTWKAFRRCLEILGKHGHARHIAYKAYRKSKFFKK